MNPEFARGFYRTTLSTTFLLRANVYMTVGGAISSNRAPNLPPFDDKFRVGFRFLF